MNRKLTDEEMALIAGNARLADEEAGGGEPPIVVTGSPPPPVVVTGSPPPPVVVTGSPPPPIVVTGGGGGGGQDPYAPDFNCAAATAQARDEHNRLFNLQSLYKLIANYGTGAPGGSTGFGNIEHLGVTYRDSNGILQVSPIVVGGIDGIPSTKYPFIQNPDTSWNVLIGGVSIPISQIEGVLHNHPSYTYTLDPASLPLPSYDYTSDANGNLKLGKDYGFAQDLINFGANATNLRIGIMAEESPGAGYKVYTYRFQNPPPYNIADPNTYRAAYGKTLPAQQMYPC